MTKTYLDTELRQHAFAQNLAYASFLWIPIAVGASWWAGTNIWFIAGFAIYFAVSNLVVVVLRPQDGAMTNAVSWVGQVAVINAAFAGHPWQIDSHMAYFAVLAGTMVFADIRATLTATAVIAVHHLTLTFLFPTLVYPSTELAENLPRTVLHAVIVLTESAALIYAIRLRQALTQREVEQAHELTESMKEAESARAQAEEALIDARRAKVEAETARKDAEKALGAAEEEAARAREADRRATEAAERDAERMQSFLDEQNRTVDILRGGLNTLRNADLTSVIEEDVPEQYRDLKDDFNTAIAAMRNALVAVQENARVIGGETEGLSQASSDLSKRSEEQAQRLAEVSNTIAALNETVRSTAKSARDAKSEADNTSSEVQNSAELVRRAVEAMGAIEASSAQIQNIVNVIEDISFQTNLLALNAGVEAARAGESGRGFAVVASEVRALAQRSSEAASEIKTLIAESDRRVSEGVGLVRDSGTANDTVMVAVGDIVARIVDIASGAEEQAARLEQVTSVLSNLDQTTQRNTAMFEETTAAVQTLTYGTQQLVGAIARFRTEDGDRPGTGSSGQRQVA